MTRQATVNIILLIFLFQLADPLPVYATPVCGPLNSQQSSPSQTVSSDPIVISSDADFKALGIPGDGTLYNPYLIEDLSFSADLMAINISNTVAYFVIRDCTFNRPEYSGDAVVFNNVTNGIIETSYFTRSSINVTRSHDCLIRSVTMTAYPYNIRIFGSSGITVEHGDFFGANHSIDISESSEIRVLRNTIKFSKIGVAHQMVEDVRIEYNQFYDCGIYFEDPALLKGLVVQGNRVNGKLLGFFCNRTGGYIDGSQYGQVIIIRSSQFMIQGGQFSIGFASIFIASVSSIRVCNVTITNCEMSIYVSDSTGVIIDHTVITGGHRGINVVESKNVFVMDNILDGSDTGIWMSRVTCYVANNTIRNSYSSGITAIASNHSLFTINRITNCSIGMTYESSKNVTIIYNDVSGSRLQGISTLQVNDAYLQNNFVSYSYYGIVIDWSRDLNISENIIRDNIGSGILFLLSFDCIIMANKILNNSIGIEIISNCARLTLYGNYLTMNRMLDALDDGDNNQWDDGVGFGNYWGNYTGIGVYRIFGDGNSIDRFPQLSDLDEDGLSDLFESSKGLDPLTPTYGLSARVVLLIGVALVITFYGICKYVSYRASFHEL